MVILHGGISSLKSDETQINNQARLPWVKKLRCESRSIIVVCAVVIGCHSNESVMMRFLFRAQDLNMTNHHAMTKDLTTLDHNMTNHHAITKYRTNLDHNMTNHYTVTNDLTTLDHNMTNGDFAFFTFQIVRQVVTYTPWEFAVADPAELPRRQLAFRAVKQVVSLAAGFS